LHLIWGGLYSSAAQGLGDLFCCEMTIAVLIKLSEDVIERVVVGGGGNAPPPLPHLVMAYHTNVSVKHAAPVMLLPLGKNRVKNITCLMHDWLL
jgi:hypothetical protein